MSSWKRKNKESERWEQNLLMISDRSVKLASHAYLNRLMNKHGVQEVGTRDQLLNSCLKKDKS